MSLRAEHALLEDAVGELLERHGGWEGSSAAAEAGWAPDLWRALEDGGYTLLGVPESAGGSGGTLQDAAVLVRLLARYGAPVPVAETSLLAGWLLAGAGLACPSGPLTAVVVGEGGTPAVPYGRAANAIVVLSRHGEGWGIALVDRAGFSVTPGSNLAGEPRDTIDLRDLPRGVAARTEIDATAFGLRGALVRSIQLAGALDQALRLSVAYAGQREQFGRPISRFQAVQQMLATMAGQVAGARAAVDAAVGDPRPEAIRIAKARASEAAGLVARLAHQVHGAMGFTEEYALHRSTKRLWAWRDEYGHEGAHALALGREVLQAGADRLWPFLSEGVSE